MVGIGLAACAAGAVVLAQIPFFYLRSSIRGHQLLHQAQQQLASAGAGQPGQPVQAGQSVSLTRLQLMKPAHPGALLGELSIPKLGLKAPVLQGTDDKELDVGSGHLTTSVLPGQAGTSILAAHNATWFRHVDQLKKGDRIVVRLASGTYTFQVSGSRVVHTGAPVYDTSDSTLVLEACYPLNALYLTPYRYLVFASLTSRSQSSSTPAMHTVGGGNAGADPLYSAQVPTDLARQGLTLATNSLPMGKLSYIGNPSQSYTQSNQPLSAANTLVALYLAWLHASADKNAADLSALLSTGNASNVAQNPVYGVPLTSIHNRSRFDITLSVHGQQLTEATGHITVQIGSKGVYHATVMAVADGMSLHLASLDWTRVNG